MYDSIIEVFDYRYLNPFAQVTRTKANLPHWRQKEVTYFVTFRLADSLPQEKLSKLKIERENWLLKNSKPHDRRQIEEYYDLFSTRVEEWLDAGEGNCFLRYPVYRDSVIDSLTYFDKKRYDLGAYVVACNHVHVLVSPFEGNSLSSIIHSWKSFSAKQINRNLKRSGALWQKEYYDHIVRSAQAASKIEKYIQNHAEYVEAASSRLL